MNYYNDNDPFVCSWLRNLIAAKLIPPGEVDGRSIQDVQPADLRGFTQVHLFCGIAGWPLALRLVGWPEDQEVWTGSPPCQPYAAPGKNRGIEDARDLWPDMFRLIRECRPSTVFGEQVPNAIRHGWLDGVFTDLEAADYACGALVLPAGATGAPHERPRLFFVADSGRQGRSRLVPSPDSGSPGPWGLYSPADLRAITDAPFVTTDRWPQPIVRRLDDGLRARVERLRAYGNAIVPQVAAEFIKAWCKVAERERNGAAT